MCNVNYIEMGNGYNPHRCFNWPSSPLPFIVRQPKSRPEMEMIPILARQCGKSTMQRYAIGQYMSLVSDNLEPPFFYKGNFTTVLRFRQYIPKAQHNWISNNPAINRVHWPIICAGLGNTVKAAFAVPRTPGKTVSAYPMLDKGCRRGY